jgi:hypothetical protein
MGVVTTQATNAQSLSSVLSGSSNPKVVYQIAQFDYNHNSAGTLVNGEGVQMGTTTQFTSIPPNIAQSSITLSRPLTNPSAASNYSFFGPLAFTGTVLGTGQADNTIILNSADAYSTLQELGPLSNIQVTGEGIDPTKTVTITQLSQDPKTGVITVQLSSNLKPSLVRSRAASMRTRSAVR